MPCRAAKNIVAAVAGDHVGKEVAGAVEGRAEQRQVLDFRSDGEIEVDGALHEIGAGAGGFDQRVAGIVDDVGVVPDAAEHDIGAGASVEAVVAVEAEQRVIVAEANQDIGGVVADNDVGEAVADAGDGRGTGQAQVLEVVAEGEGDGGEHSVDAGAGALDGASRALLTT